MGFRALVLGVLPLVSPGRAGSLPEASTNEVVALRNAIADLTATFGNRYPERSVIPGPPRGDAAAP